MSSAQQQLPLPRAPRPAFANLHHQEQIEDFALARDGGDNEARAATTTILGTTRFNPAAPAFVPAAATGPSMPSTAAQASTFQPRPTLPLHLRRGAPKSALARRADEVFKSSFFRAVCSVAIRQAVHDFQTTMRDAIPPTPIVPPPLNWQANPFDHQRRRRFFQEPLHPWWSVLLERFRAVMLRLLWGWGEGREWFAGELGGDLEEGELREQLERGIRGGMEFEMRRARRFWFET